MEKVQAAIDATTKVLAEDGATVFASFFDDHGPTVLKALRLALMVKPMRTTYLK